MILFLFLHTLALCSRIADESTALTPEPATPEPVTRSCYHCYIRKEGHTTVIFANPAQQSPASLLERCPVTECTGSCAIATSSHPVQPAIWRLPTEMPWNATTDNMPSSSPNTVELVYRVCVASTWDLCSSFAELQSENCRQEKCMTDLCNKEFSDKTLVIIVGIVAGVLLAVLAISGALFGYWRFKIIKCKQYREPSIKQPSTKRSLKKIIINLDKKRICEDSSDRNWG